MGLANKISGQRNFSLQIITIFSIIYGILSVLSTFISYKHWGGWHTLTLIFYSLIIFQFTAAIIAGSKKFNKDHD